MHNKNKEKKDHYYMNRKIDNYAIRKLNILKILSILLFLFLSIHIFLKICKYKY